MNIYQLQLIFSTTTEYKQYKVDVIHSSLTRHELYEKVFIDWLDKNGYVKK